MIETETPIHYTPALGVGKTEKRKVEGAKNGIGCGRKDVSAPEVRVIDIKIGRVRRAADLWYVRGCTVTDIVPIDTGKPRMILFEEITRMNKTHFNFGVFMKYIIILPGNR